LEQLGGQKAPADICRTYKKYIHVKKKIDGRFSKAEIGQEKFAVMLSDDRII
jgi:hypothetical protein